MTGDIHYVSDVLSWAAAAALHTPLAWQPPLHLCDVRLHWNLSSAWRCAATCLSKNDASCTTMTRACGRQDDRASRWRPKTRLRHLSFQRGSKITHRRRRCRCRSRRRHRLVSATAQPCLAARRAHNTRIRLMHLLGNGASSSSEATCRPPAAKTGPGSRYVALRHAAFRLTLRVGREAWRPGLSFIRLSLGEQSSRTAEVL